MAYNKYIGMRRSSLISIAVLGVALVFPFLAHAASTSFFGPIVSSACNCPTSAPGWGCVLATFQNVMSFLVSFATVLITVFIAVAGFTYMTSGGNAEKRQLANKRLTNAVIGLAIVLCAYLLVDSIMKVIYNPNAAGFGPWNSILGGNPGADCFAKTTPPSVGQLVGTYGAASNATGGPGVPGAGSPTVPANLSNAGGACSASAIESAVQAEGGSISASNASVLACVAGPESSCGTNPKALVPQNNGSSALGPFQVTVQSHAPLFNNPQCEAAGGVSGPLNCQNAFSGGNPIPGATLTACEKAADDLGCEGIVASQVYNTEHISAWGAAGSPQRSCGQ